MNNAARGLRRGTAKEKEKEKKKEKEEEEK